MSLRPASDEVLIFVQFAQKEDENFVYFYQRQCYDTIVCVFRLNKTHIT